jgi:hypothetical protein
MYVVSYLERIIHNYCGTVSVEATKTCYGDIFTFYFTERIITALSQLALFLVAEPIIIHSTHTNTNTK